MVWHTSSRILERRFLLCPDSKDFMLKKIRAYEDFPGVEVLTFCLMDNHFHLLLRVPQRPEGLDVPLEVILAWMERAVGENAIKLVRRVVHFTRGMMLGSREFVDGCFEANRSLFKGRSRTERKRGSRCLGRSALRGLYALRDPGN